MVPRGSMRRACFHAPPEDWLINRPQVVIRPGSVFHRADSLSEFLQLSRSVALSHAAATYLGFRPPLDITASLPICESVHRMRWRRPRCSQPFDGFCNAACERISSRSRVQGDFLVQGLVHFVQPSAFFRLVAPLPLSARTLTCKQAATHAYPDSDALLHTKPLAISLVFSRPNGLLPSSSFVLPQVHLKSARPVTCPRTLMSLALVVLDPPPKRWTSTAEELDSSAFPTSDLDAPCDRSLRPARAFRTFHN